jgi:capsular polysaccharide biosynthesis protein
MEEKEIQIDLRELLNVFLSKIGYVLVCAVVFAAVAFFYTKLAVPYRYTSSVSLYVTNNTYNNSISDSVNISDVNASQQLVDTYRIILSDDVVMDSISEKLNENYSQEELSPYIAYDINDNDELMPSTDAIRNCISFSSVEDTEILKVDVTTRSPKLSAEICSYITEIAPETIIRVIGAGSVEPIGKVKVPKAPSGPNVKKNTLVGFMAGFVLAVAIVFIIYFMDNTLTNGDAFKNRIDLPVLGEIPSYDLVGKGEDKNEK